MKYLRFFLHTTLCLIAVVLLYSIAEAGEAPQILKETAVSTASAETVAIVNDMLRSILTEAGKLREFTLEQLPDVVVQFLKWKFYESLVPMVTSLFFLTISAIPFLFYLWKGNTVIPYPGYSRTYFERGKPRDILPCVFSGISFFYALLIALINCNLVWLHILIAPKAYLLEYAATVIK